MKQSKKKQKVTQYVKSVLAVLMAIVLTIQISGSTLSARAATGTGDSTLIENPNFGYGDDGTTAWTYQTNGAARNYKREEVPGLGNVRVLNYVQLTTNASTTPAVAKQTVSEWKAGESYKLSFWAKITGEGGKLVVLRTLDSTQKYLQEIATTYETWKKFEVVFSMPEQEQMNSVTTKELLFQFYKSETERVEYYITDVQMTVNTDATKINLVENGNTSGDYYLTDIKKKTIDVAVKSANGDTFNKTDYETKGVFSVTRKMETSSTNVETDVYVALTTETNKQYAISFDLNVVDGGGKETTGEVGMITLVHKPTNGKVTSGTKRDGETVFTSKKLVSGSYRYLYTPNGLVRNLRLRIASSTTTDLTYTFSNIRMVECGETDGDNVYTNGQFVQDSSKNNTVVSTFGLSWARGGLSFAVDKKELIYNYAITYGNAITFTDNVTATGNTLDSEAAKTIALEAGKTYDVSYLVQTDNNEEATGFIYGKLVYFNTAGTAVPKEFNTGSQLVKNTDGAWKYVSYSFTVPEDIDTTKSEFFRFYIRTVKGMTISIADVSIKPTSTAIDNIEIAAFDKTDVDASALTKNAFCSVAEGASYTVLERWEKESVGQFITSDETVNNGFASTEKINPFKDGDYYRYSVVITPKDGYTFTDATTVTVNGEAVDGATISYAESTGKAVITLADSRVFVTVEGDANADGGFDVKDVVRMKRYLSNDSTIPAEQNTILVKKCDYDSSSIIEKDTDFTTLKAQLIGKSE